eukprot:s551_g6.t1
MLLSDHRKRGKKKSGASVQDLTIGSNGSVRNFRPKVRARPQSAGAVMQNPRQLARSQSDPQIRQRPQTAGAVRGHAIQLAQFILVGTGYCLVI